MTDDGFAQSPDNWPLPTFYFKVEWDGHVMSFQEVSGLDVQSEEIVYRQGDSPIVAQLKMPGRLRYSNVTMKKGIFKSDNWFWDWFNQIKMNTIARKTITISLMDEADVPAMVWKLANAWPTKITGTDLKSEGNEVAVESIEIACEGITARSR